MMKAEINNLTVEQIDALYQSMSAKELWHLNDEAESVEVIWTETPSQYPTNSAALTADDVDWIENEPLQVPFGKILLYCQLRKISIQTFLADMLVAA